MVDCIDIVTGTQDVQCCQRSYAVVQCGDIRGIIDQPPQPGHQVFILRSRSSPSFSRTSFKIFRYLFMGHLSLFFKISKIIERTNTASCVLPFSFAACDMASYSLFVSNNRIHLQRSCLICRQKGCILYFCARESNCPGCIPIFAARSLLPYITPASL